ncbi:MAG: mitochondrial carrier [Monoraphidium minutum]|nr:MAG: mitochondrial carrier [Monoraphidium minutum]
MHPGAAPLDAVASALPAPAPGAAPAAPARAARGSQAEAQQRKGVTIALDLVAGTAAGTAQLLVGHPFDCIKVKLQSQAAAVAAAEFRGPMDAVRQTFGQEGVRGFYRGMAAPFATVALFNAVLFTARGQAQAMLAHADGSPLTLSDELLSSLAASAAVSLIACPTELLKCRLQAQGDLQVAAARLQAAGLDPSKAALYRGPRDVAAHVLRYEGGAPGLFKGLGATLLRESLGNLAMFGCYHVVKDAIADHKGVRPSDLGFGDNLVAGGLGGTAFWLACYPTDVVKSKLQVDSYTSPQYRGMLDCARKVVAAEGAAGLFRGFGPALLRSFPANAVCFATYEAVASLLQRAV